VPLQLVAEILEPRLEEIFTLVRSNIARSGVYEQASAGVVLSGGGSQLPGTPGLASAVLDDLPVRVGSPRGISGHADAAATPVHATGVGLALLAAEEGASATQPSPEGAGLLARVRGWFERILPRA